MTEGHVSLVVEAPLGLLTLERPDRFNALDLAMLEALAARLDEAERAPDIRVLLVGGAGKGFCAGGDVDAWGDLSPADFQSHWVRAGHRIFDRLARLRQPVIAVIDGHALGGGLELAACADLRVAEAHVKLGFPEAGIGVVPGWSGTQRAVRRFGGQAVRRMALGGDVIGAEEALRLGVVDRVVETGAGMAEARDWAHRIAARGPLATEAVKMLIGLAEAEDPGAAAEALASGFAAATEDAREGVAAFRARKPPVFSRR